MKLSQIFASAALVASVQCSSCNGDDLLRCFRRSSLIAEPYCTALLSGSTTTGPSCATGTPIANILSACSCITSSVAPTSVAPGTTISISSAAGTNSIVTCPASCFVSASTVTVMPAASTITDYAILAASIITVTAPASTALASTVTVIVTNTFSLTCSPASISSTSRSASSVSSTRSSSSTSSTLSKSSSSSSSSAWSKSPSSSSSSGTPIISLTSSSSSSISKISSSSFSSSTSKSSSSSSASPSGSITSTVSSTSSTTSPPQCTTTLPEVQPTLTMNLFVDNSCATSSSPDLDVLTPGICVLDLIPNSGTFGSFTPGTYDSASAAECTLSLYNQVDCSLAADQNILVGDITGCVDFTYALAIMLKCPAPCSGSPSRIPSRAPRHRTLNAH